MSFMFPEDLLLKGVPGLSVRDIGMELFVRSGQTYVGRSFFI